MRQTWETASVSVALPPGNSPAQSANGRRVASFLGTRGLRKGLAGSLRRPVAPGLGRNVAERQGIAKLVRPDVSRIEKALHTR